MGSQEKDYAAFKPLCIVNVAQTFVKRGYLHVPLETLNRGYLLMIPEGLGRDLWRFNADALRMNTVVKAWGKPGA